MSNFRQNKAHQTVQVMGCADNPLAKGLSNGAKYCCECGVILNQFNGGVSRLIAKNYIKLQFDNQKQPNRWGWMGHNGGSKNLRSTQRLYRCSFVPLIIGGLSLQFMQGGRLSIYGGVWQAQAPRCRRQLEHPHLILGGIKSKTYGGNHA